MHTLPCSTFDLPDWVLQKTHTFLRLFLIYIFEFTKPMTLMVPMLFFIYFHISGLVSSAYFLVHRKNCMFQPHRRSKAVQDFNLSPAIQNYNEKMQWRAYPTKLQFNDNFDWIFKFCPEYEELLKHGVVWL